MDNETSESPKPLEELRQEIDAVNQDILGLLNRRARLAQEVGETKRHREEELRAAGKPVPATPFFAPSRESQIFKRLAAANKGPLSDDAVISVFREIISQCRALEEPMQVAYWGPVGSHSYVAARSKFGTAAEFIPVVSIGAVFDQVEKGLVKYGVVPAGNSLEGVMSRTLDLLATRDPAICAETYLPLSYDLVSQCGSLAEVQRVYASAQPLALCSGWLAQHLPNCELVEVPAINKAMSACKEDPEGAAVVTPLSEHEHPELNILQTHVEDDPRSRGRFFVIGFNEPERSGFDKTSVLITIQHKPGSMVRTLEVFSRHGVNLTFVQTRHALRNPNVYRLFVDAQGFIQDEPISNALDEMSKEQIMFKILGSYPDAHPNTDEPTD